MSGGAPWVLASWVLLTSATTILLFRFYIGDIPLGLLFNPDIVYIHLVVEDFLFSPQSLENWTLPSVTFWVPDFILFGVAAIFSSRIFPQYTYFAFLQLLSVTVLIYLNLTLRYSRAMAFFFASSTLLGLVILINHGLLPLDTSISPVIHFGSIILYLFEGFFLLCYITGFGRSGIQLVVIGLINFCSIFSDKLIVIQFQLPLLIFMLYYLSRRPCLDFRLLILTVAGSSGAAMLALRLLMPDAQQVGTTFALSNLEENLRLFSLAMVELGGHPFAALAVALFGAVCMTLLLVGPNWLRKVGRGWETFQPLAMFFALSIACNLLVVIFSNQVFTPRYILPFYFIPLFTIVIITYEVLIVFGLRPIYVPMLAVIASAVPLYQTASVVWNAPEGRYAFDYYPPSVACVDNVVRSVGMHRGMAGYMDAKTVQALSREKIILAQYKAPYLSQDVWETSTAYFSKDYDFALIDKNHRGGDRVDIDEVKKLNGDDIRFVDCDPLRIYYYDSRKIKVY
jgi:hypothetical protein